MGVSNENTRNERRFERTALPRFVAYAAEHRAAKRDAGMKHRMPPMAVQALDPTCSQRDSAHT
ncbi:hypothetical protein AB4084_31655, partial [Lysobacter sp. 2RAB21]